MPGLRDVGRAVGVAARGAVRGVGATASGSARASRWAARNAGFARNRSGQGNVGMMRLLDLHAASCAGDVLVTIGLAGTVFFSVPLGEARGRVALYLVITMVPFILLAPLIGPALDRFRHGRRYALATTMLGRAVLAWVIAGNIDSFALYPAAFGVLALSRAYGVARSAAVPRLLPAGLGLSQAGARASVFGTAAGALVAPIGVVAAAVGGPEWALRISTLIFMAGALIAMNLPPRADSDPPETVPKLFQLPWRHRVENGERVLSGPLVVATLTGSGALRALYGFLLLFLAFAVKGESLPSTVLGIDVSPATGLALVGGALGLGSFVSTAIGTRLRIKRPVLLQAGALLVVALLAISATLRFTLGTVIIFCLGAAVASGLAKLCVDAVIQERIPEQVRASAFAHAETLLMLGWVLGGTTGLIPFGGQWGIGVAALAVAAAAARSMMLAARLHHERLTGSVVETGADQGTDERVTEPQRLPAKTGGTTGADDTTRALPAAPAPKAAPPVRTFPAKRESRRRWGRRDAAPAPPTRAEPTAPTRAEPTAPTRAEPTAPTRELPTTKAMPAPQSGPGDDGAPGFHIYRPSPPDSGVSDPRDGR